MMCYDMSKEYIWASPEDGYAHLNGQECRLIEYLGIFHAPSTGENSPLYVTDTKDAEGNHYTASKEDLRLKDSVPA